jgi:NADH dehydrogenase
MTRIVIVGGGFGGATLAQRLERWTRDREIDVVLVDRHNYFVFTPLLVEAGTGALEPRHAVVPLREFLRTSRFLTAEVVAVDTRRHEVTVRVIGTTEDEIIPYDQLVLAPGSVTRLPDVPGLAEFGFEIKSLPDAVGLRDRAIQLLEQAEATPDPEIRRRLLHVVVVGANLSGVEVAGEFHAFLREASLAYRHIDARECNVTLVEAGPRILPVLDPGLSEYARAHLEGRGLRVLCTTTVTSVAADRITLPHGGEISASTVIWCAGIAPSPLIAALGLPTDGQGRLRCDSDMRVRGCDDVWALGDSASIPDRDGTPYPATAQHATRQAAQLADNLRRVLAGEATRPCEIASRGALAALGCRSGVADLLGWRLSGFPAWFLWRSVYLMKMPGLARRLRVALDWTMELFFSRPIVQFGIHHASARFHRTADAPSGRATRP